MSVDLLFQAAGLAAVGMATVFVLFAALIAAVAAMTRIVDPRRQPSRPEQAMDDADLQAEMAAAVTAAIRHHRARMAAGAGTGP